MRWIGVCTCACGTAAKGCSLHEVAGPTLRGREQGMCACVRGWCARYPKAAKRGACCAQLVVLAVQWGCAVGCVRLAYVYATVVLHVQSGQWAAYSARVHSNMPEQWNHANYVMHRCSARLHSRVLRVHLLHSLLSSSQGRSSRSHTSRTSGPRPSLRLARGGSEGPSFGPR